MDPKELLKAVGALARGVGKCHSCNRPHLTLHEEDDRFLLSVPFDTGNDQRFDTFLLDEGDTVAGVIDFVKAHIEKVRSEAPTPAFLGD